MLGNMENLILSLDEKRLLVSNKAPWISYSIFTISSLLVFLLGISLTFFPIRGGEFLTKISAGRALANGTTTFGQEPFSYMLKDDNWVHVSWLFDWLLYQFWQLDGETAQVIVLIKACSFAGLGLFIFWFSRLGKSKSIIPPILAAVVLIGASGQADLGPHLISLFFLSFLVIVLIFLDKIQKIPKAFVPITFIYFALWANCDSLFQIGVFLVLIWLSGKAFVSTSNRITLAFIFSASVCGTLFNPFGLKIYQPPEIFGWFHGALELDEAVRIQYLAGAGEWMNQSWIDGRIPAPALSGLLLTILGLILSGFSFYSIGISAFWRVALLSLILLFELARYRMIGIGAIVSGLLIADFVRQFKFHFIRLDSGPSFWLLKSGGFLSLFLVVLLGLFTNTLRPSARSSREFGWGFAWSDGLRDFARSVAIKNSNPDQQDLRMLVVESGTEMASYLIWFNPEYRQFMDSRWSRCSSLTKSYRETVQNLAFSFDNESTAKSEKWKSDLKRLEIDALAANLSSNGVASQVAMRFSNVSDWDDLFLAGSGQFAKLRKIPVVDQEKSLALVTKYLDSLVLESTFGEIDWEEGSLDIAPKGHSPFDFWVPSLPVSGKSIEAEIRGKLATQYRRQDTRISQSILAVRQARIATARNPNNAGGLLVALQCLGQMSDILGIQQEGGVLSELIELEMTTLAQRVIDLGNLAGKDITSSTKTAHLVLYQVAARRGFIDQMEVQGKALVESSRLEMMAAGNEGIARIQALEKQVDEISRRRSEVEDRYKNSMDQMLGASGGRDIPHFVKAVKAIEAGLPLLAQKELNAPNALEQVSDNEQMLTYFALLSLQLDLQVGRVDKVMLFLNSSGRSLIDRPGQLGMTHPGILLPQLLNSRMLQVENRNFPLYDWLLIEAQVSAGRYRAAAEGLQRLSVLRQDMAGPALLHNRSRLILSEGPFGFLALFRGARENFSFASQLGGSAGIPSLARTLNPVVHELGTLQGATDSGFLRLGGMLAELDGVCGYYSLVSGNIDSARKSLHLSTVESVNLGYVARSLIRLNQPSSPAGQIVQESTSQILEGTVPSWHLRLGWVRSLESIFDLEIQTKHSHELKKNP